MNSNTKSLAQLEREADESILAFLKVGVHRVELQRDDTSTQAELSAARTLESELLLRMGLARIAHLEAKLAAQNSALSTQSSAL